MKPDDNPFIKASRWWKSRTKPSIIDSKTSRELDRLAQLILADAVKQAPVLTGALRASGRVRRINKYRRAIEFGGRGTGVDYASYVEFGTMRTRPQPFLRPALERNKKNIKNGMGKSAQRVFGGAVFNIIGTVRVGE